MPAYVILDIDVTDAAGYEEYKQQGAPTLAPYGGKPRIRGEVIECLEGTWQPRRLVMIEFESMEKAREWWESPEYREAKKLRHRSARTNVVLADGM
jgi:uncharacterized protein (DUF1330 family)